MIDLAQSSRALHYVQQSLCRFVLVIARSLVRQRETTKTLKRISFGPGSIEIYCHGKVEISNYFDLDDVSCIDKQIDRFNRFREVFSEVLLKKYEFFISTCIIGLEGRIIFRNMYYRKINRNLKYQMFQPK